MRTEQIVNHIVKYTDRLEKKREDIDNRVRTVLGDSILLAVSVVYLGPFAPEERARLRGEMVKFLTQPQVQIDCSYMWLPNLTTNRSHKVQTNMFFKVLKELGLRDLLKEDNFPGVLTPNDLSESLFCLLFAPSCPVVADPTGQLEEFVKKHFLASKYGQVKISAADIFGNEKVQNLIKTGRSAIVSDLNFMRKLDSALSQDLSVMKRLATTIYNGFDFVDSRTAQLKRINAIDSFFRHFTSANQRVRCFDNSILESISMYQIQVF